MTSRATARVTIVNQLGMHARPATLFTDTAHEFRASVRVAKGDEVVDGKSIMHLMMLAATRGTELEITAEGEDAQACVDALVRLIGNGFDED